MAECQSLSKFEHASTLLGDHTWSYDDELKLLNAINNYGFGNWPSISQSVPPYTATECETHYMDRFSTDFDEFMDNEFLCSNKCGIKLKPGRDRLGTYSDVVELNTYLRNLENNKTVKPYMSSQDGSDVLLNSKKIYNYMLSMPCVGYNRIRSDFDIEHDNAAESLLKMICDHNLEKTALDPSESSLFEELEFVLCQTYNNRLKERNMRKKIVRNHCLIDRRKTFTMLQRLDVAFGRTTLKALTSFLRFFNGPDLDFLIEGMKYQNELRLKLHLYIEYRNNGLKFMNEIDIFKHLKNKRLRYCLELSHLQLSLNGDSQNLSAIGSRKPTTPLALGHLPGYNLLNEDEKKLCSLSRIVPETYNTFKEVLIAECEKHNGLKLAQARNLIKIDVNKTRKIYDYLISSNLIWQPES